jgi:hypothetical protein
MHLEGAHWDFEKNILVDPQNEKLFVNFPAIKIETMHLPG